MQVKTPIIAKVLYVSHIGHDVAEQPHILQAVECADGMLRVFLDGEPMRELVWPADGVSECINTFLAQKLKLLREERRQTVRRAIM